MIRYFERIPSAAIWREIDGNFYGRGMYRLGRYESGRMGAVKASRTCMRRVAFIRNGEAYLEIGKAGDAIAATTNQPFDITMERA